MKITRKDFVRQSLWVMGAALVLPACGGDDDDDGSGGSSGSGGSGNGGSGNGGSGNGGAGGSGNGGAGGSTGGSGGATGCSADIVSNHGHQLNVSEADIAAGVDKTYDIQGGAGHAHSVTVTAAHFASLGDGGSVSLTSTNALGHEHSITVSCA